jgi:hypothetical protein
MLNTISINLYSWDYCPSIVKPRYLKFLRFRDPCSCDTLDETVGRSLASLMSLKTLRIYCWLCPVKGQYGRHGYLSRLKTRSLDTIKFTCYCVTKHRQDTIRILTAPCMKSVAALTWIARRTLSTADENLESVINQDMLPNLRHLHHTGEDIHNLLLRNCSITRLSATLSLSSRLDYNSLKMNRGRLTHMSINFLQSSSEDFFRAIAHDAESFRNLQHLGTFDLKTATCLVSFIIPHNITEA